LQNELSEKDKLIASSSNKKGSADDKALISLQNEINTKNKQVSDLQAQVQKDMAEKKTYTQTIQKYQNDIAAKNTMIDALSNIKIPTDDKLVAKLQKDISAKDKQISSLTNELNEKNKAIAAAPANKLPADQKGGLAALQNELSAKNKQISTLQAEVRKEAAEKENYSQTIQSLQLELIEKNKIIASAGNRKVATDQKAVVTLQNEIAEKDKRIKKLEDQLSSGSIARQASYTNPKETEVNTNLRIAYNNTMSQLGLLQKKYNTLKAEMDQLKSQR
jgi:chromosome segregation ATPase